MIDFILLEEERDREEKRRFYQSQIDGLRDVGLTARLLEFPEGAPVLPEGGGFAVFDVECRRHLRSRLDLMRLPHVPVIWNPYTFFEIGHMWIRHSDLVIAALAPGPSSAQLLRQYELSKPIEIINITAEYSALGGSAGQSRATSGIRRIGYFSESGIGLDFIRGVLTRRGHEHADLEWIPVSFESPSDWHRDLARCDILLSLRGLSGSAIPLLEAMASGVIVMGTHGGGLRDIAGPENGLWIESGTLETIAAEMAGGLKRMSAEPAWRRHLVEGAIEVSRQAGAEAVAAGNMEVWRRLAQRASLV